MRPLYLLTLLFLSLTLQACRCADEPEVGPVEDDDRQEQNDDNERDD